MTNREHINQMTDEELAEWAVDMGMYCARCHDMDNSYCVDGKGACLKEWLGKKKENYDEKDMAQRIRYNLMSKAESVLDEIKEKFPDAQVTIEIPSNCCTVRLGDANIYVSMGDDLVIDAE